MKTRTSEGNVRMCSLIAASVNMPLPLWSERGLALSKGDLIRSVIRSVVRRSVKA